MYPYFNLKLHEFILEIYVNSFLYLCNGYNKLQNIYKNYLTYSKNV